MLRLPIISGERGVAQMAMEKLEHPSQDAALQGAMQLAPRKTARRRAAYENSAGILKIFLRPLQPGLRAIRRVQGAPLRAQGAYLACKYGGPTKAPAARRRAMPSIPPSPKATADKYASGLLRRCCLTSENAGHGIRASGNGLRGTGYWLQTTGYGVPNLMYGHGYRAVRGLRALTSGRLKKSQVIPPPNWQLATDNWQWPCPSWAGLGRFGPIGTCVPTG